MRIYVGLLFASIVDLLFLGTVLYASIVIILFCVVLYRFLQALTTKICIMEIIAVVGCLIYLVLPVIAYEVYNEQNYFATLYKTTMPIEAKDYFALALPGTILLIIGLNTHTIRQKVTDLDLISRCEHYLCDKPFLGIAFIAVGIIASVFLESVPEVLRAIVYYASQLTFIGYLYLLHTRVPGKAWITLTALALLIGQSSLTGMYGELVFWSVLGLVILMLRKRIPFFIKSAVLLLGALFILLLQSVKQEYRLAMWTGSERGSKPSMMFDIAVERLTDPASIWKPVKLFAMATRLNQGYLVARAMDHVPRHEPFARGETITTSLSAALAPRFIWKDKPEVGGRYMVCRFLGDCWKLKYSYNIGQLGEGYVNFGVIGGAIFMFLYGWVIRTSYAIIANLSIRNTTLILWTPLFFFAALSLETDFLTFINSFTKAVFFCLVVYGGTKLILNSMK